MWLSVNFYLRNTVIFSVIPLPIIFPIHIKLFHLTLLFLHMWANFEIVGKCNQNVYRAVKQKIVLIIDCLFAYVSVIRSVSVCLSIVLRVLEVLCKYFLYKSLGLELVLLSVQNITTQAGLPSGHKNVNNWQFRPTFCIDRQKQFSFEISCL